MNLPGDPDYNPGKPRLMKVRQDHCIASMILCYVDDMRAAAANEDLCWEAMHTVSTRAAYLGIQIASRKTRPPSTHPGPWAGSVVTTQAEGIGVKVSQDKWDKTKKLLQHTLELIEEQAQIPLRLLESYRGSLVYIQRTYPSITPYLKGYHLTIDSWRPDRDLEGWRLPRSQPMTGPYPATPECVHPVPRFHNDVLALLSLFDAEVPPTRYVRSRHIHTVQYGFADASGSGYGYTLGTPEGLTYAHGVWGEGCEGRSSNFRELTNVVQTIEQGVNSGQLRHAEVWIFTDNGTSESVFWKGHSSSPNLSSLILRLRQIEMTGLVRLHMVHVPGTRMITQGTDGLSRGDLTEGVMTGQSILEFIPLNKSALERQPSVAQWVMSWVPDTKLYFLQPEDWYDVGHGYQGGHIDMYGMWNPATVEHTWFVWAPPPALADAALDEFEESRHKRKDLNHVWIVPRLMTYSWRKRLSKICDIVFSIPPGTRTMWPASEHEPLLIGLTLCFSHSSPWQTKFSTGVLDLERSSHKPERSLLREFCDTPRRMGGMPGSVV